MSNFFSFEKDSEQKLTDPPFSEENPFLTKCFGNTAWFSLSGWSSNGLVVTLDQTIILPKGEYEVGISRELKGKNDYCQLKSKDGSQIIALHKDPPGIKLEKQTEFEINISFFGTTHYLFGDWYQEQEDYGKDYEIQVKLISGGIYDRDKVKTVLKGDLNGDGKVDLQDLFLLKLMNLDVDVSAAEDVQYRADIGGVGFSPPDGKVDAIDLLLLQKYLTGKFFIW